MSDTTDVKVLTLNQKTVFNTSAAIERVKIHNNSSFFLRIYYGADAPTDPNSGAGWHETIDPGGTPLCEVVGNSAQAFSNRSYIQSTPYLGVITVMPFLPVGALAGAGGVVTGMALTYLTAYYPGEWAQEGGEIEAYVQAAKQARVQVADGGVFLPVGQTVAARFDETYAPANAAQMAQIMTLSANVMPNVYAANAAAALGATPVLTYIYGFHVTLRARTPGVARVSFIPQLQIFDSTGVTPRASATAFFTTNAITLQASEYGVDRLVITPAKPLIVPASAIFQSLALNDILWFGTFGPASLSGAFECEVRLIMGVDSINVVPLTSIQGFNQYLTSSNPVLAPSTFNPETY